MSSRKITMAVMIFALLFNQCVKKKGSDQTGKPGFRVQKIMVTFVLGKAFVKSENTQNWKSLRVGKKLKLNDSIRVKRGKVVLQSVSGSVITIKKSSEIVLNSIYNSKTGEEDTKLTLKTGRTTINPRKLIGKSKFNVTTPAMVAGVRGTVFTVEHTSGKSKVAVQEGKVAIKPSVKNEKISEKIASIEVKPGEKSELTEEKTKELEAKLEKAPESIEVASTAELIEVKEQDSFEKEEMEAEAKEISSDKLDIKISKDDQITTEKKESIYFTDNYFSHLLMGTDTR